MTDLTLDRRSLLKLGGGVWATAVLTANFPAIAAAAQENKASHTLVVLDEPLAATIRAITGRIIPTTETPGALEAGAIWFIDAAMTGEMGGALPLLQAGAAQLDGDTRGRFSKLPEEEQDRLLTEIEGGDFFNFVYLLTLAGTFTMPKYGGNEGEIGWDLLGFERQHYWPAPFGYYDRNAHGQPADPTQAEASKHHNHSSDEHAAGDSQ